MFLVIYPAFWYNWFNLNRMRRDENKIVNFVDMKQLDWQHIAVGGGH